MDQLREASTSFHAASDDVEDYWKGCAELWGEPEVECEYLHGFPAPSTSSESQASDDSSGTTLYGSPAPYVPSESEAPDDSSEKTPYEGSPTSGFTPFQEFEGLEAFDDESNAMSLDEIEASLPRPEHVFSLANINASLDDQRTRPHAKRYTETCNSLSTFLEDNVDLQYSEKTLLMETLKILSSIPESVIKDTCVWDYYFASEARFAVTSKALEMMSLDATCVDWLELNYNARNARDHALADILEVEISANTYNFDQVMPAFEAEQMPSTLVEDFLNSRAPVTGLVEQPANATPSQSAFVAAERGMAMFNQRAHQAVPLGRTQSLPVFPSSASCASQARTARQPFGYPCITTSTIYQIQE